MKNKILSFNINVLNKKDIYTEDETTFFQYIKNYIEEAEKEGKEHFDITIEETEC